MCTGWALARGKWWSVVAAAVAGVILLGACTSDPQASPNTTTVATNLPASTATTPPATTVDLLTSMSPLVIDSISDPDQVEIAEDLLRAQQGLRRALMEPVNPDYPEFVSRYTGDALRRQQTRISKNRDEHIAYEAPSVLGIRVESMSIQPDGNIAATACLTFGARSYHSDTGETIDTRHFSQRLIYFMYKGPEHWQVALENRLDEGTYDATDCAPR